MKGKGLILAGLGVVSYLVYKSTNKVAALNLLDYEVQSLKAKYKNLKLTLTLKIGIINPSKETFQFKGFIGEVSTGGVRIAPINFTPKAGIIINPNSTTPLPIDISLNAFDLPSILSQGFDFLKSNKVKAKDKPKSFDITGLLQFNNFQLPVQKSITLTT